jgi:hypothetical protein
LIKPCTSKIEFTGSQRPIRMVPCIFTISRGYAIHLELARPVALIHFQNLFTDADMHNPAWKEEMEVFYHTLQRIVADNRLTLPSNDYDLVLDITKFDNDKAQWSYYYACHETRCLFWLEPYDGSYMISELAGVDSPAHVSASQSPLSCT